MPRPLRRLATVAAAAGVASLPAAASDYEDSGRKAARSPALVSSRPRHLRARLPRAPWAAVSASVAGFVSVARHAAKPGAGPECSWPDHAGQTVTTPRLTFGPELGLDAQPEVATMSTPAAPDVRLVGRAERRADVPTALSTWPHESVPEAAHDLPRDSPSAATPNRRLAISTVCPGAPSPASPASMVAWRR